MSMTLSDLIQLGVSIHQTSKANDLHKRQVEESKELHKRTLDEMAKLNARMEASMQMQALRPMSLPPPTMQPMQVAQPVAQPVAPMAPAPAPESQQPYSNYLKEYGQSKREDVSVGCVPCTRAHLSTVAASLKRAENGDKEAVNSAREEMAALLEYDLTPEKLERTPEIDREVLAKYRGQIDGLQKELEGPVPEITTASASLKEAMRFARADGVQHPEVQERMARTEDLVNETERVSFSPERLQRMPPEERERVKAVLPKLREARQDLINNVHNADDLESVTVRLAEIDKELNPPPAPEKIKDVADKATNLNTDFRRDVIKAWTGGGH